MTNSVAKTLFVAIFILLGMYLGINSLLAIPEIDDDKSKTKELNLSLKEELQDIKKSFVSHLNEIVFDSSTLSRYDSINKTINYSGSGASLKASMNARIQDHKFLMENRLDLYYYAYLNTTMTGLNEKRRGKNQVLAMYKNACSFIEDELATNMNSLRVNINRLYAVMRGDTSKNYGETKKQIPVLMNYLSITPPRDSVKVDLSTLKSNTLFKYFFISNIVVKDESQTLALIIGLIGFGLLGSVIGTFSRSSRQPDLTSRTEVLNNIYTTIIKSFSAAILSYLSIKGGISVITSNKENNANPYFVLFVCFIAAVFSEEIWEWAKKKVIPG